MKIEWLNDEKTRALVTKGWFRKRCAEVYKASDAWWRFRANEERVSSFMGSRLDNERDRSRRIDPWRPVERMPTARLVERKP